MIHTNKLSLMALALCAGGALVACGTDTHDGKLTGGAAASAMSEDSQIAAEQLLFIAEGQSEGQYGIACTALRTDLFAARQALKLGTDWGNLIRTEAHKSFSANWNTYKGAGCNKADPRSECEELRSKISNDIIHVTASPEWGVLVKNGRFQSVAQNYGKARAIDCIAPTAL